MKKFLLLLTSAVFSCSAFAIKSVHLKARGQWAAYGLSAESPFTFDNYEAYKVKGGEEDAPLYTATSTTSVDEEWESEYQTAYMVEGELTVEAYDGYVIVKSFDGVEGYDLAVAFDEEENATAVYVYSEEGEADAAADWAFSGKNYWYVYLGGYSYASSDPATQTGYVCLSTYVGDNYCYYNIVWGSSENGLRQVTVTKSESPMFNLAGQKVGADHKGFGIKNGKKLFCK